MSCAREGHSGYVMPAMMGSYSADGFEGEINTLTYFTAEGDYRLTRKVTAKRLWRLPCGTGGGQGHDLILQSCRNPEFRIAEWARPRQAVTLSSGLPACPAGRHLNLIQGPFLHHPRSSSGWMLKRVRIDGSEKGATPA